MTDIERDPLVRRAIDELRRPAATDRATDRAAVARVVAAAAAARVAPSDDEQAGESARPRRARWWTLGGVAAAAAVAGFVLSNARRPDVAMAPATVAATPAATRAATRQFQPALNNSADALPVAKQFVFHSRSARTVSVVGDFNRWSAETTPMKRDGELWSATVSIFPGRHLYGFMVDDSVFVLDPREAKGRDADLGVEASVTIVGRP